MVDYVPEASNKLRTNRTNSKNWRSNTFQSRYTVDHKGPQCCTQVPWQLNRVALIQISHDHQGNTENDQHSSTHPQYISESLRRWSQNAAHKRALAIKGGRRWQDESRYSKWDIIIEGDRWCTCWKGGKFFVDGKLRSTATNVRKWDRTSLPTGHLWT